MIKLSIQKYLDKEPKHYARVPDDLLDGLKQVDRSVKFILTNSRVSGAVLKSSCGLKTIRKSKDGYKIELYRNIFDFIKVPGNIEKFERKVNTILKKVSDTKHLVNGKMLDVGTPETKKDRFEDVELKLADALSKISKDADTEDFLTMSKIKSELKSVEGGRQVANLLSFVEKNKPVVLIEAYVWHSFFQKLISNKSNLIYLEGKYFISKKDLEAVTEGVGLKVVYRVTNSSDILLIKNIVDSRISNVTDQAKENSRLFPKGAVTTGSTKVKLSDGKSLSGDKISRNDKSLRGSSIKSAPANTNKYSFPSTQFDSNSDPKVVSQIKTLAEISPADTTKLKKSLEKFSNADKKIYTNTVSPDLESKYDKGVFIQKMFHNFSDYETTSDEYLVPVVKDIHSMVNSIEEVMKSPIINVLAHIRSSELKKSLGLNTQDEVTGKLVDLVGTDSILDLSDLFDFIIEYGPGLKVSKTSIILAHSVRPLLKEFS